SRHVFRLHGGSHRKTLRLSEETDLVAERSRQDERSEEVEASVRCWPCPSNRVANILELPENGHDRCLEVRRRHLNELLKYAEITRAGCRELGIMWSYRGSPNAESVNRPSLIMAPCRRPAAKQVVDSACFCALVKPLYIHELLIEDR